MMEHPNTERQLAGSTMQGLRRQEPLRPSRAVKINMAEDGTGGVVRAVARPPEEAWRLSTRSDVLSGAEIPRVWAATAVPWLLSHPGQAICHFGHL